MALARSRGIETASFQPVTSLPNPPAPSRLAFGEFEFRVDRLELLRQGAPVRLQQQPLKLLACLLRRPGELVTREEVRREVWPEGIHLDFADALNHTVKYLRDALGDEATSPRYIETVPRRGYRFIAPVHPLEPVAAADGDSGSDSREQLSLPTASRAPRWRIAAAVVALLVLAVLVSVAARPASPPRVLAVTQVTHFGLAAGVVTDGHRLFVEQGKGGFSSIVEFPADGAAPPKPLPTPFRNTTLLDISPDGRELLVAAFDKWNDPRLLWILPIAGGAPRRVANLVSDSGKWSPDGSRIAVSGYPIGAEGEAGIYLVYGDGSARRITVGGAAIDSWSPDGKLLRVTRTNSVTGGMTMWQVSVPDGAVQPFLPEQASPRARWGEGLCCGRWTPDGRYFIYQQASAQRASLWAIPTSPSFISAFHRSLELYPAAFRLSVFAPPAMPAGNHRAFVVGSNEVRELARFDPVRRQFVQFLPGTSAQTLAWSPDRQWIAYVALPDLTLWKCRTDGSARVQLTRAPMQVFRIVWSPDGSRIAFHTLQPGKPGKVGIVSADGGPPEILFESDRSQEDAQNWSPDGTQLMFSRATLDSSGAASDSSIWILDLRTHALAKLAGSDDSGPSSWSPDGQYVAAISADGRTLRLLDLHSQRWSTLATGVYLWSAQWTRDSKAVVFQDTRVSEEQPIYRVSLADRKVTLIAARSQFLGSEVSQYGLLALTPDGQPIVSAVHRNADVYALDLDLP